MARLTSDVDVKMLVQRDALGKEASGVAFQCYRPLCLDGCALLRGWSPDYWADSQTARAQQG